MPPLTLGFGLPLRLGGLPLALDPGALSLYAAPLDLARLFFGALRRHGGGRDRSLQRARFEMRRILQQHLVDQQGGIGEPSGGEFLLRLLQLPLQRSRAFLRLGLLGARFFDGLAQRLDLGRLGVHAEHAFGQQPARK